MSLHSCPECYEYVPCDMDCSIWPDLQLDNGTERGAHDTCAQCLERIENQRVARTLGGSDAREAGW